MQPKLLHSFDDLVAKYKVEIIFGSGRTPEGPNLYWLLVWNSSGLLAAEGDTLMGFCPNCKLVVIPRNQDLTFCQGCQKTVPEKKVADRVLFKTTMKQLSGMLVQLFFQLDGLVDVFLKFHPSDIRYTKDESDLVTRERLETARRKRIPSVYTLKRILEDTQGGRANLKDRFQAFLKA